MDILHRVGTNGASPEAVYEALTTLDGLAAWWTTDTTGNPDLDGVMAFRFGGDDGFDMLVRELVPGKRVLWEVVAGPDEWIGTEVLFDLRQDDGWTIVLFEHRGWRESVEFMNHCSTKWATFLLSLVELLETGSGRPYPHELRISNWK
ncbi:MAG: polyketide cyclase [Aeromicrobium sp.]|nr:polyketide cyclase [Aeromicrobium sp.]